MKKYHRRYRDELADRDPSVMWMDVGGGFVVPHEGKYLAVGGGLEIGRNADILLQTELITHGRAVERGRLISSATTAWSALRSEVLKDPSLFELFPSSHRKFEEFLAGAYSAANWNDVILSPRSHDQGFDIAAQKRGKQILDEAKAYKPTLLVTHQVVRAALGLLIINRDVDQVRVTTTSNFAPLIVTDLADLIPDRLALRDQRSLLHWLKSIRPS